MERKKMIIILISLLGVFLLGSIGISIFIETKLEQEILTDNMVTPSEIIMDAALFSPYLQVGETIVEVPCSMESLFACDVKLVDSIYNATYLLGAGEEIQVEAQLGEMRFVISAINEGTQAIRLSASMVTGISNITKGLILLPGGIGVGKQSFEEVQEIWGESDAIRTDVSGLLTSDYYEEGVALKDIYAWNIGAVDAENVTTVFDIAGSGYVITYDRATGEIVQLDATFSRKSGKDIYENRTQYFAMGTATIPYLKDCVKLNENDKLSYCIQTIDEEEYVIGVGITGAKFDEQGKLLDSIRDEETVVAPIYEEYLNYSGYDFTGTFSVSGEGSNWETYYGEIENESVFFALSAEIQDKSACGLVFYMHPLNRDVSLSDSALSYMSALIKTTRAELIFG